jgi:SAM-dependent methyltransferase
VICRDCRHVWRESFPPEEELRDYYRRQYTQAHSQSEIQSAAREYYSGHLADLLGRVGMRAAKCRICDYGCSIPVLLEEAVRLGFREAVGVDYGQEIQDYGAARGIRVLLPEHLMLLPDASLDIIRFPHTLEHGLDPLGLLGNALRKVRPGGWSTSHSRVFPCFDMLLPGLLAPVAGRTGGVLEPSRPAVLHSPE